MISYYVLLVVSLLVVIEINAISHIPINIKNIPTHQQTISETTSTPINTASIDTSLYSRQLLVYGQSAQLRLSSSKVLIIGNGKLAQEIAKNLALSGIGTLYIASQYKRIDSLTSIMGKDQSLVEYVKAINSHVKAIDILDNLNSIDSTWLQEHEITTLVLCDEDIAKAYQWNQITRQAKSKFIWGTVYTTCGFVFNDFLHPFYVEDVDGEVYKEVPLSNSYKIFNQTSIQLFNQTNHNESFIQISCIPEESLDLGLQDHIQITLSTKQNHSMILRSQVMKSISPKSCVIRIPTSDINKLHRLLSTGQAILQKIKSIQLISHQSLSSQWLQPSFSSSNACLSTNMDLMMNYLLFAFYKTLSKLQESSSFIDKTSFQLLFQQELITFNLSLSNNHTHIMIPPMKITPKLQTFLQQKFQTICDTMSNLVNQKQGQCPGTISVIGSIVSQEVLKSITHLYTPINQFYMFESMDSLHKSPLSRDQITKKLTSKKSKTKKQPVKQTKNNLAKKFTPKIPILHQVDSQVHSVYGDELLNELASMRIFVVGSGAIGCELLKNFALLGVGTKPRKLSKVHSKSSSNQLNSASLWSKYHLQQGGILLTDMDTIERSNLNRQLLFRSEHIGQSKALMAAKQVLTINPFLHIQGITHKVDVSTEHIFDEQFWNEADLVITALDNVEARKYVDKQCLLYQKPLLDSGTLGTKANSQVIYPYLTETYASSSDPPEQSIPLCTLKSFPYQPEHCVAWAKQIFETSFDTQIQFLQTMSQCSSKEELLTWISTLSSEDRIFLSYQCSSLPVSISSSIAWAKQIFTKYFHDDILLLQQQNPIDSLDEDGHLFWEGSRRYPHLIRLNMKENINHRQCILLLAKLRLETFGLFYSYEDISNYYFQSMIDDSPQILSLDLLNSSQTLINIQNILRNSSMQSISFEKDNLSLGHVQLVQLLSNLRGEIYSIRSLDEMEVRKIAGNIIPAVATTTSLIAGLVTLELVKVASERILYRKYIQNNFKNAHKSRNNRLTKKFSHKLTKRLIQKRSFKTFLDKFQSIHHWKRWFNPISSQMKTSQDISKDPTIWKQYILQEKNRLLTRFRNVYLNLAQSMIAFTQPVPIQYTPLTSNYSFSLWDKIHVDLDPYTTTPNDLITYFQQHYQVDLISINYQDMLIYGNFLTNQEDLEDQSIVSIIEENYQSYRHLILEIYGTSSNHSEEIKLPPVILSPSSSSFASSIQKNQSDVLSKNSLSWINPLMKASKEFIKQLINQFLS